MLAPQELVARLDQALTLAVKGLRQRQGYGQQGMSEQAAEIERSLANPDIAQRIIAAAQLGSGLLQSRQLDHSSEEIQQSVLYYEDCVGPAIELALELLRYEEVETYILANSDAPSVQRLLQQRDAQDNLSAGLFRKRTLEHPKNVVIQLGPHRLTFLVRDEPPGSGVTLVVDERGSVENVCPRVVQTAAAAAAPPGSPPRYVLVHKDRWVEKGKVRTRSPYPVVVDLEKALYVEPEDSFERAWLPDARVVGLDGDDILFENSSGQSLRAPMRRFKLYRLLPF